MIPILLFAPAVVLGSNNETMQNSTAEQNQCIQYDSVQNLIEIVCRSVHLTDIYNNLSNPAILGVEKGNNVVCIVPFFCFFDSLVISIVTTKAAPFYFIRF